MSRRSTHTTIGFATGAAAAACLLGAVALAGCGGSGYEAVKANIFVIGDSITVQSTREVKAALAAAGWHPTVQGISGSTIAGGTHGGWPGAARRLVQRLFPEVVVVELGTNDTAPNVCCAKVPASIDAMKDALAHVPHVLWLNVQEGRLDSANAARVNRDLEAAAKQWSNLHIVDFSGRFAGRPEWHVGPGPHLTPAGQVAFAQLVAQAAAPWAPTRP